MKLPSATARGQPVAEDTMEKSQHCSGYGVKKSTVYIYGECLQVSYCEKNCERKEWSYHRPLCEAMQQNKLLDNFSSSDQGDGGDAGVYISHITPNEKEIISKLVGSKCIVTVIMNKTMVEALFDIGAQSIISSQSFELISIDFIHLGRSQGGMSIFLPYLINSQDMHRPTPPPINQHELLQKRFLMISFGDLASQPGFIMTKAQNLKVIYFIS